jgi:autotransporter-associated beta strand protein
MIPRLNWRRVLLVSTGLILGLTAVGSARAATVLTADSVQKLVVVEDNANFLVQVALMVGQVPQVKGLTSDEQSGLIEGSWSDVQTAAAALVNAPAVAGAASTSKAVAQPLNKAYGALSADITNLGTAVTANSLSAATQKAFQKLGQDAQSLVTVIQRDYAMLPATQRPAELSIDPATGQARVFAANTTVKFVLSGPKTAISGGNGTWALTSGRQDPTEPPLSTPFVKDGLTGSSASARQAMHATATVWGAWTYIYYQYGVRRPTLLLLNLGGPGGGNTTGGNTTDGGSLDAVSISVSGGNLDVSGDDSVTITGSISNSGNGVLSGNGSLTKTGTGVLVLTGTDTYTGGTIINSGTLQFTTLNDLGTGNLTINGGTLSYVGGTSSTNRTFTVGSNGGDIDSSGTGPITFTNTGNLSLTGGGPTTLTFTGENTGNNTFAGNITDQNGGNVSVTKSGAGTWILTGNNTYTGNTTVSAGTLVMTNLWLPPGNIFVVGTGTFAYQPDANDSLTVSAVPVDGSAYAWGNTTYEVDVQTDGSWVLPALNLQIVAITGGYELMPWSGSGTGGDESISVSADTEESGMDLFQIDADASDTGGVYDLINFSSGLGLDLSNLTLSNLSTGLSYTFSSSGSGAITLTIAPNTTTDGGTDGSN